jgi:translation initiation factor IF-2
MFVEQDEELESKEAKEATQDGMEKIRINDLARELEVKSKAILDYLPTIGIDDKKSHSSSLEGDQVERVRKHFQGELEKAASGEKSRSKGPTADEIKTKIDLSKISKPGDVLKAIKKTTTEIPAPVVKPAPPAPSKPAVPVATKPTPPVVTAPAEPPAPKAAVPFVERPQVVEKTTTQAAPQVAPPSSAPHATPVSPSQAATPVTPPPAANVPRPQAAPPVSTPNPASSGLTPPPLATQRPAPQPPPRRVITPQTGPRPVYSAPAQPRATVQPGQPIGQRSAPGRPVPGQPIFQRPRPFSPGAKPPLRPGERRLHPTRMSPTGVRPTGPRPGGGAGPALPPPPDGVRRPPGGAARRPGQRYVPRGVKEGPMKGFVPPPTMSAVSNEPLPITRSITITEGISVKDLAEKLEVRPKDIIARLLARGVFASINQTLDSELASAVSRQFGADTSVITFEQHAEEMVEAGFEKNEDAGRRHARPPVVTIMGHVDHGKTSLLDAIRETNVAGGEAGGITQHIGAYKVKIVDSNSPAFGREIVFLDTPGHEAFTRMRARGAKVTDIVVLVVAADDGVMPQTLEAIDHANAANVPIIVAINKIDKPGALPERPKKQLADRGLVPEDWGGKTVFVEVSAKQKTNLNLLLEMICLVADLGELKAAPERPATGAVLEAKLDRGRGAVATVLVQNGTLRNGDTFIVGNTYGKVRAMFDDRGKAVDQAPPSTPVEVLGLEGLPQAGDQLSVVADRDKAKQVSQYREAKAREATLAKSSRLSLEGLAEQLKTAGVKELPIILKGDVQGSVEVLADSLSKLSNEKVKIKVLHTGVGAITETDVLLASASNAIIIGFNVRPERKAQELAEQEEVDIRLHSIIYELQDEIKKAMTGLLEPVIKETYLGRAEVRDTFKVPKVGTVAGCYVQDGIIKRDAQVRLLRDNVVVFTGKVGSLRRFKDDASEVRNGMECGISIANYSDIKVGDIIEAFVSERVSAEAIA